MMWAFKGQRKLCKVGSLLPPLCGFLALNLGHQACTVYPTESSCWPCPHLAFICVEAGESNLGPSVCMANTLPTEPSSSPKLSTCVKFPIWSILLSWNLPWEPVDLGRKLIKGGWLWVLTAVPGILCVQLVEDYSSFPPSQWHRMRCFDNQQPQVSLPHPGPYSMARLLWNSLYIPGYTFLPSCPECTLPHLTLKTLSH